MKVVSERRKCFRFVSLMLDVRLHLTQRFLLTTELLVELRELQQDLRCIRMLFENSSEPISRLGSRIRNNRLRSKELMPGVEGSINQRARFITTFGCNRLR